MADVSDVHILVERRMTSVLQLVDGILEVVGTSRDLGLASVHHGSATFVKGQLAANGGGLVL